MKVGLSTQLGLGLPLERHMRIAAALRVQYLQVRLDDLDIQRSLRFDRINALEKLVRSLGLRLTAHLPFIDVNLASLNPEVLHASRRTVGKWFGVLGELGVETVVAHAGKLSGDYPQREIKRARANLIESARELSRKARAAGMLFTVENDHNRTDYLIAGRPREIKEVAKRAACGVTFDVGHANTLGQSHAFVGALGDLIGNVHLSDNDGSGDQHLLLGNGTVDFRKLISQLAKVDYQGSLIIEVRSMTYHRKSLARLRTILASV